MTTDIKGGGRVKLNDETQTELISLLLSLKSSTNIISSNKKQQDDEQRQEQKDELSSRTSPQPPTMSKNNNENDVHDVDADIDSEKDEDENDDTVDNYRIATATKTTTTLLQEEMESKCFITNKIQKIHRIYVKQLIKRYQQQTIRKQLFHFTSTSTTTNTTSNHDDKNETLVRINQTNVTTDTTTTMNRNSIPAAGGSTQQQDPKNGTNIKVRLEIVHVKEVHSSTTTNKNGSTSSSSNKGKTGTTGTTTNQYEIVGGMKNASSKLMIVDRNSTIVDFLKLVNQKLQLKSKKETLNRAFIQMNIESQSQKDDHVNDIVTTTKNSKKATPKKIPLTTTKKEKNHHHHKKMNVTCLNTIDIDLLNLYGIADGSIVFVTTRRICQTTESKSMMGNKNHETIITNNHDANKKQNVVVEEEDEKDEEDDDPLEFVKRSYRERQSIHTNLLIDNTNKKLVDVSPSVLTTTNNSNNNKKNTTSSVILPSSSCRAEIIQTIQNNQVTIISGSTGSGKSTQIPQYLYEEYVSNRNQNQNHMEQQHEMITSELESESLSTPLSSCQPLLLQQSHNVQTQQQQQHNSFMILVTQPRRVAAISLAYRVSDEMHNGSVPGKKKSIVGYHVRLDKRITDTTKIMYCTTGILLRTLICSQSPQQPTREQDSNTTKTTAPPLPPALPPLSNISHVILDEVHERDLNIDFTLLLIRSIASLNKNIKIILMSATATTDLFIKYFTTTLTIPKHIVIPGKTYPIEIKYLLDCEKFVGTRMENDTTTTTTTKNVNPAENRRVQNVIQMDSSLSSTSFDEEENDTIIFSSLRATDKLDYPFIAKLILKIAKIVMETSMETATATTNGAILVFLPGKREIEMLTTHLRRFEDSDSDGTVDRTRNQQKQQQQQQYRSKQSSILRIYPLHSTIPRHQQQIVFQPPPDGTIKVVLATNIAETSITIPDVVHVVDTCRVKESCYNSSTRIKELVTVWTSQASAQQRSGRAGRTTAGICWRLCSREFFDDCVPKYTTPEILRTPLDELILQICLLYEQRRDDQQRKVLDGVCPISFLQKAPDPPNSISVQHACQHLLEVGALRIVSRGGPSTDAVLYRLTPLGYHLSRLPMDAKVGKVLIVGCMLECVNPAVTIAATLSTNRSLFQSRQFVLYSYSRNTGNSGYSKLNTTKNDVWDNILKARNLLLINSPFSGKYWSGGFTRGDIIASVAVYNEWEMKSTEQEKFRFCKDLALDLHVLKDIQSLRAQFLDCLRDAGFIPPKSDTKGYENDPYNRNQFDSRLTSCCLVAGLYPNIATLMRPQNKNGKGSQRGKLITKNNDECLPGSESVLSEVLRNVTTSVGKDVYAVYHSKHKSVGTGNIVTGTKNSNGTNNGIYLNEVNFVSRIALLLFGGGDLELHKNTALVVDGWLKFKIGDSKAHEEGAVLFLELRKELDTLMVRHLNQKTQTGGDVECTKVVDFVKLLLEQE